MENFYTLLSNTGINAIITARASNSEVKLTKIAVGDGDIIPSQDMTALKSEKHRFNINSIIQDIDNPNYLIIEGVIPSNVGGFYVSEVAIYTDQNILFAIGSLPKTYKPLLEEGSAKDLTIKIFLEITNADSVTLKVDDSVVLATRKFVLSELKKYALINGDETKRFKVADAVELNEAINKKQLSEAIGNIQTLPAGAIISLATSTAPSGFLKANGAEVSRATYSKLFEVIGTTFGEGDGSTTFKLPDLRGEFIRGWDDGKGVDAGRIFGSWQVATAFMGDGDGQNIGTPNLNDSNHYAILGYDLDIFPANTRQLTVAYPTPTSSSSAITGMHAVGGANNGTDFARTRPRNIALLYCIKY